MIAIRWLSRLAALLLTLVVGVTGPTTSRASATATTPDTSRTYYTYNAAPDSSSPSARRAFVTNLGMVSNREHAATASGNPARLTPDFVAADEGAGGLSSAYHYTGAQNVASIESKGLRAGAYATPDGSLSPLQAQIDLALPPNRGLPGATLRVDLDGLRNAGYEIPSTNQVGRSFNMPGGGTEMQFPYPIPPQFIKVVP